MKLMLTRVLASTVLAAAVFAAGGASAHAPKDPKAVGNIAKMSVGSALVFRGSVAKVDYRLATGAGGSLPYTYVTYRIGQVLQGEAAGKTITLRFPGGPDGRGGFVDIEGVPVFEEGNEDILFVRSNGEDGCPLVQCEFGRYRVLDGAVYEAHGSPVVAVKDGRFIASGRGPTALERFSYPAPSFDDLMKRPGIGAVLKAKGLTVSAARARYEAEAPKRIQIRMVDPLVEDDSDRKSVAGATAPLTVGAFVAAASSGNKSLGAKTSTPLASARLDRVPTLPALTDAAPIAKPRFDGDAPKLAPEKPITKN